MPIPAPVAVIGAGFIGATLVERLRERGLAVVATSRSGQGDGEASPRRLDLVADPSSRILECLGSARSVVCCYSSGGKQDRRRLFIDGGIKLWSACAELGLKRIVYTSSTSALPDVHGVLDEDCEAWPDSERGRIQREAETEFARSMSAADMPWTILRFAGLYGPGRELGRLYREHPDAPLAGDGMKPTNLIHRDDAVMAILLALELPPSARGLIHVCDDDHSTRREMFARVAAHMGRPAPTWDAEPAPGATPRGKIVSNARMKRILGLKLAHPMHEL